MAESAAAPLLARIAHQAGDRTRLSLLGEAPHERLVALADALAESGVDRVEIRTVTGSIILTHAARWETVAACLPGAGLVIVAAPPPPPQADPIGEAGERVSEANLLLTLFSQGRLDLRNAAFLGLVVTGLVQLARGRVAGPALTLFGQALTLAMMRDRPQR